MVEIRAANGCPQTQALERRFGYIKQPPYFDTLAQALWSSSLLDHLTLTFTGRRLLSGLAIMALAVGALGKANLLRPYRTRTRSSLTMSSQVSYWALLPSRS